MTGQTLSILLNLADRKRLALILALSALGAVTEGLGFVLLVPLLALFLVPADGDPGVLSPVLDFLEKTGIAFSLGTLLIVFAVLVTIRAAADYWRMLLSLKQNIVIVDGLRARAFAALVAADWKTLARMRQSDNRAMLISEIDRTGLAIDVLGGLTRLVIGLVAIGTAAIAISPVVALAGLAIGAIVLLLYGGLRRRAHQLGEELGRQYRLLHGRLEESLNALRTIKSFGREQRAQETVLAGFASMREVRLRFVADSARARALLQIGAAVLVSALAWLAVERWDTPPLIILPLVALYARALPQLSALLDSWQNWSHAAPAVASADRLIREAEAAAEKPPGAKIEGPLFKSTLELRSVSLAHREGALAVDEISLTLNAGEMVALIGPSGAGKSTLADILGGLLEPDSGALLIDRNPLDPAARYAWRSRVAYVDQTPALFHGTVRDNLLWAKPEAEDEELLHWLEKAAADFVADLPGGLDCHLGEGGQQLSGGERQRIVLARALLRDPDLLILDEATSALDPASDEKVAAAIAGLQGSRTILIIGHRGALTNLAPRQVTLENGRIVKDTG